MPRTVVLPSRASRTEGPGYDGESICYVEDWFEYDQFDAAYAALLDAGSALPEDCPWKSHGVDLWRPFFRELFVPAEGNLKYLYPIATKIDDILSESECSVTFVWPKEDYVTDLVRSLGDERAVELTVRIDSSCSNPIPRTFRGDGYTDSSSTVVATLRSFVVLAGIHFLLVLGTFLPGIDRDRVDLIYAHENHRELTDKILDMESVEATLLQPKLLGVVRALAKGRLGTAVTEFRQVHRGNELAAEDVLRGNVFSLAPYRILFRLVSSRSEIACHLRRSLGDNGFTHLPDSYLFESFRSSLLDSASLKYLTFITLYDEMQGISTLTSVSGGKDQEFLFEIGRAFQLESVDLNHSVLMSEPTEIRNRSDTVVVKGTPDLERLQEESPDKRLVLTGRPYNDKLYERLCSTETTDVPDPLRESTATVTVATEPIRNEHISRLLENVFQSQEAEAICIKLHPKESKDKYRNILSDIDTRDVPFSLVYDEYELFDLLLESDVLVTGSSNVGLEALFLGVPGLHVDLPPNVPLNYQTTEFFEPFAVEPNETGAKIDDYLATGLPKETVDRIKELYLFDGEASERLVDGVYHRAD